MKRFILFLILFSVSSCTIEYRVVSSEGRSLKNRGVEDDDDLKVIKVYRFKNYEIHQTKKVTK